MLASSSINDLRSDTFTLPEFLTQVEAHYVEREAFIHAFIQEENRFIRLHKDAEFSLTRYPDLVSRPQLFGALVGVKDIFHVEGFTTQAGSRLPAGVLQGREAESVTSLKEAGALILGKTVTTEFAYFSPGPTRNPHHLEHTPGGSSSGSAAAVAAGFCQLALGTQTIGSIIRPASFCGVVGVKPTFERISRTGVIPLSPSLDHVGSLHQMSTWPSRRRRFCTRIGTNLLNRWRKPWSEIPEGPVLRNTSEDGLRRFEDVCKVLEQAGYKLQYVHVMADLAEIISRHNVIMSAEAAQVHNEWLTNIRNCTRPSSPSLFSAVRESQMINYKALF